MYPPQQAYDLPSPGRGPAHDDYADVSLKDRFARQQDRHRGLSQDYEQPEVAVAACVACVPTMRMQPDVWNVCSYDFHAQGRNQADMRKVSIAWHGVPQCITVYHSVSACVTVCQRVSQRMHVCGRLIRWSCEADIHATAGSWCTTCKHTSKGHGLPTATSTVTPSLPPQGGLCACQQTLLLAHCLLDEDDQDHGLNASQQRQQLFDCLPNRRLLQASSVTSKHPNILETPALHGAARA